MPTVSVIIPAYNAEKTIAQTIRSIQAQTFSNFEIIVINDGSTDGTVSMVNAIADPRIKVFSYENGGLPVARNRGMTRATGDFISFIDADDQWTPDKLELQLQALQNHPEAGVAYSWTAFVNEAGHFLYAQELETFTGYIYPQLLLRNFICSGSNILARRQVIEAAGEFDATLKSAEDWDYYLRLASHSPFVLVPKCQILYLRSSQSMTAKIDTMERYTLQVIEKAFQAAPPELQYLKKQSMAYTYRYLAKQCVGYGLDREKAKQASQKFSQAISLYPRLLFDWKMQKLGIKLLLLRFAPQSFAHFLTRLSNKPLRSLSEPV